MPGPRSPLRAAKEQHVKEKAKVKAKHNWPAMKRGHVPDDDSMVHQLPNELTMEQKSWWDKYLGPGTDFHKHKGNRGDPEGAMGWVREVFIGDWWDEQYPNSKGVSKDDRLWYAKHSKQERVIWTKLNNSLRPPKGKDDKVKQWAIGHDAYREESPKAYDTAVDKWKQANGSNPPLHEKRKISYQAYTNLPNQRQQDFREKAVAKVKESQKFVRITDPVKLTKFTHEYWDKMRKLLKYGFEHGGIDVCALVVHQTEEGKTRVTRQLTEGIEGFSKQLTEGIEGFSKSSKLAESMDALKEFLQDLNEGATFSIPLPMVYPDFTKDGYPGTEGATFSIPLPMVYPDFTKDGYPCLPNFEGWSLRRLQKLLCDFVIAVFKFQGGVGRLMWKEIKERLEYFFDMRRLPKVKGLILEEPSNLAKKMVLTWLSFFMASITRAVPPEE
ncbi:hypothetical protein RSAG8_13194, partial [Rhizoctonia solani AG-8 WAC10335]